jgi:DHA1 family multidrug resistance protein-like MFS transporter
MQPPTTTPAAPFPWKRNLAVLWVAQVVTTLGFSFTFPFFPIYFRELGVESVERAAFWAGASGWMLGLGMGLCSPLWGALSDRYGRKLNVVRAMALAGLFLFLSAFAQNPTQLLISRFFVGATSGVLPTIMALVAVHTPRERLPFATGSIQSALFLGTAIGPLLGGIIFDHYGLRAPFYATAAGLGTAAVLVLAFTREEFSPPVGGPRHPLAPFKGLWGMITAPTFLPLIVMIFMVQAGVNVMLPVLPGVVETIDGGSGDAYTAGLAFMALGIGSSLSAVGMGMLAGWVGLRRVFLTGAVLAALASFGPFFAGTYWQLVGSVGLVALFYGGLAGLLNGVIAMRTPRAQHGAAFGASQTGLSAGVAVGPLVSGAVADATGLRNAFLLNVALFALITAIAARVVGRRTGADATD